jgi:hypothetical protein
MEEPVLKLLRAQVLRRIFEPREKTEKRKSHSKEFYIYT